MCRRKQLPGAILAALGTGLLTGSLIGPGFLPFLIGIGLAAAGLLLLRNA